MKLPTRKEIKSTQKEKEKGAVERRKE